jgi:Tfp pilus assembly protein PilV
MNGFFKQKVTGFTVMEILITMVISGIVVLTALQFYTIFNRLLLQKNDTMEGGKNVLQLYNMLKNDAVNAVSLNSSTNKLTMRFPDKESIQYEFFDEYVIRTYNILIDTIRVKTMNFNTEKDQTTGFDKIITLELMKDKETFPVIIEKTYPNDVLINTTISPNK